MPENEVSQKMAPVRFFWWKSSLFWRTFILVGILLVTSMGLWIASNHVEQRVSRTQYVASQIASIVTVTRAALVHSEPELRRQLLFDLVSREGLRIYPKEKSDIVEPIDDDNLEQLYPYLQEKLGENTIISSKVNDVSGLWVSFYIDDDDEYWLRFNTGRIGYISGLRWFSWGSAVLLLSIIGAVIISRFLNDPLSKLASSARQMAAGIWPKPLPIRGVTEIRELNASFNQMASDLERVDADRTEILAGISHDLRTPLTRVRLELEMANLSNETRQAIESDLDQMNDIVGQFLDYARLIAPNELETVDLTDMLQALADKAQRSDHVTILRKIDNDLNVRANLIDMRRLFTNIVTNAIRYGATPGTQEVSIDIQAYREQELIHIVIADHGQGVDPKDFERLLRPFTRSDASRSQANGSGLGLAIVQRIAKRYGGTVIMGNRDGGGLMITITVPYAVS